MKSVEKCIDFYEKQVTALDKQIDKVINKHSEIKVRYDAITSVKGVVNGTTYFLIAEMPELGNIEKREVVALAKGATMNCDSSRRIGKRRTEG